MYALPDLVKSMLELRFVRICQGWGKQYCDGYGGRTIGANAGPRSDHN